MKQVFLYAYKNYSVSAKLLSLTLNAKRIKHKNSKFKPRDNKFVINWGSTKLPKEFIKNRFNILNPKNVDVAVNKFKTMNALKGKEYCLPFTTDIEVAKKWIEKKKTVVCRTLLTGNSGAGIVIADVVEQLVEAPLYTQYIPKKEEYRVHVFKGEVLQVQRKAKRKDVPAGDANYRIRNHNNGFIFQIHDFDVPAHVIDNAIDAVTTIGLDFGAVDVIYNEREGKSYVLEVNTAPGIEGTTLELYTKAIKELLL